MDKQTASKIHDEAREKIDEAGMVLGFALFAFDQGAIRIEVMDCYRDTFAQEILALSGTTDIECPECHGHRRQGYTEGNDGELGIRPCPDCNHLGVIKHKWKIAVVLENGELPEPYVSYSVSGGYKIVQRDMLDEGYRQVVE